MFGRWFKRSLPIEDRVWIDAAARDRGLRAQVASALQQRASVLLLVRSITDREDLVRELAAHAPQVGGDRFAAGDLQARLRDPCVLGLATVDDLRATARVGGTRAPLQVHVVARGARRGDDRRLLDLLAPWSPALVAFHSSLDDPLLREHTAVLQPLLEKLGFHPAEPVASPHLSRAIERAQRP